MAHGRASGKRHGALAILPAILVVAGCAPDPSRQAERLVGRKIAPRVAVVRSIQWCATIDQERVGQFQIQEGDSRHGVLNTRYLIWFRKGRAMDAVLLKGPRGEFENVPLLRALDTKFCDGVWAATYESGRPVPHWP